MSKEADFIAQESIRTANDLKTIAQKLAHDDLSRMSLPEIEQLADMVGRMLPAGNIPSLIVSGLARLQGRKPPRDVLQRDIDILFRGVQQTMEKAVYSAFFAGPAAVIWGYQRLLQLAGKDADAAFPDGTWQFYVDYALREDTARHANETHGFATTLDKHGFELSELDRLTGLVMAVLHMLHDYDDLLENEWRERVYCRVLVDVTQGSSLQQDAKKAYRQWELQRPYARGHDAYADENYVQYRHRKFDDYFEQIMAGLDPALQQQWVIRIQDLKRTELRAYQQQMNIRAYLHPETYHETRVPISLEQLHIGLIHKGCYYFIPIATPHTQRPLEIEDIRNQIATILEQSTTRPPSNLTYLAQIKRAKLSETIEQLNTTLQDELTIFQTTPIIINADITTKEQSLAALRQVERGIGHHALTILDTGKTFVFDQSHIFFDGAWGAALAEIITNEALSWSLFANQLDEAKPTRLPHSPNFTIQHHDLYLIAAAPTIMPEASAESDQISLTRLLALRRMFKQRNDLLRLTVNDILVLYRAIHALSYVPSQALVDDLNHLKQTQAATAAHQALQAIYDRTNPAILIPVDASQNNPRERLFPMSFEVPLTDLGLLELHKNVMLALYRYDTMSGERGTAFQEFMRLQKEYLATLAGFGAVLSRAKEIAVMGESSSVGTIKLLAHIPTPLQRLLDQVPGRFDVLNDIIKGREVFSNVGVVASSSTLTRFITAKDDNEKKTLAWGVLTDAKGVMRISLRDFRPHVKVLQTAGYPDIAQRITQDYLDGYVNGLNQYLVDLQQLTRASRDMRTQDGEES